MSSTAKVSVTQPAGNGSGLQDCCWAVVLLGASQPVTIAQSSYGEHQICPPFNSFFPRSSVFDTVLIPFYPPTKMHFVLSANLQLASAYARLVCPRSAIAPGCRAVVGHAVALYAAEGSSPK